MKRVSRTVGLLIAILGLVFVARELARNGDEVLEAVGDASPVALIGALLIGLLSMASIGLGWRLCLRTLGDRRPVMPTLRNYFVGQLGKYVPGGIWPVVGRAEMARRDGVSGAAAYGSTVLSMIVTYLAAVLTALGAVLLGAFEGGGSWLAALWLLPAGLLALHPYVVNVGLRLLRRISNRELAIQAPRWTTSISLLLWHVPTWFGIGTATWMVAATLQPGTPDYVNVMFATTLAWVAGFVAVGVPGGIGVREAVFVATVTSMSSTAVAAVVALVARVMFVVVDLLGAAITSLLAGRGENPDIKKTA